MGHEDSGNGRSGRLSWGRVVGAVAPVMVLLAGVLGTIAVADFEKTRRVEEIHERIAHADETMQRDAESGLRDRARAAQVVASALSIDSTLGPQDFERLADTVRGDVKDISGVGYVRRVRAEEVGSFVAAARRDGAASFGVISSMTRPDLAIVLYAQPEAQSPSSVGSDVFDTPSLAVALGAAVRSGSVAMTDRVFLPADGGLSVDPGRAAYVVYAPVFAQGMAIDTPEQRAVAVAGWSSVSFWATDLLAPVRVPEGIVLALQDGVVDPPVAVVGEADHSITDAHTLPISVLGKTWLLQVTPTARFIDGVEDRSRLVLALGLILTVVLAGLVASLASGNRRWAAAAQHATRSLADSEEHLRATIAGAPDMILVVDQRGTIRSASQRAVDLLGIVPEDLTGRQVDTILDWSRAHRPDEAPTSSEDIVLSAIRADGSAVAVEVGVSPLRPGDEASPVVAVVRDVSQRQRAHSDRALLSSIVSSTQDPIIAVSLDGLITSWNRGAERFYGWSAEEAVGRHITLVVPDEHQAGMSETLARVASGESVVEQLTSHCRRDGSLADVAITLSPLPGLMGEPAGASLITHDMTVEVQGRAALASYAAELERSNRDLEEFASIASHDLSEPLRVVGGYVGLLTHRYTLGQPLDGRAMGYLSAVAGGVERMRELIEGLLEFSRLRSEVQELGLIDLAEVTDTALANLSAATLESNAVIEVGPLPVVRGDRDQLLQLMQNLLANAIRFRDLSRPARIIVTADFDGDSGRWRVSVTDNGIGIPLEHQDQIFAMFRRLQSSEHYAGVGIGLAVCRRVVDLHGGELRVDSTVGRGSTFTFALGGATRLFAPESEVTNA